MNYSDKLFVFGEILFDIFGTERKLGGAPFNVAYNLHMQGHTPVFISRVGVDEMGAEILSFMKKSGMPTSCVGTDTGRDTGMVIVELTDGEPEYDIRRDVAYDNITACDIDPSGGFMYYGTLACRSERSKETLLNILKDKSITTFYDVNLRRENWDIDLVCELASYADYIKLNEEELNIITNKICTDVGLEARCRRLIERFGIKEVYVTCGSEGAVLVTDTYAIHSDVFPVAELLDTVGAGDAFSSVVISGLIEGLDNESILNSAAKYASKICSIQGALTEDKSFYNRIKEELNAVTK